MLGEDEAAMEEVDGYGLGARTGGRHEIRRRIPRPGAHRQAADEIRRLADPGRHYRLMEVCGGHTHAIYRFGLKDVLPPNIELIHGPGCPVCVLPMGRIDDGLALAGEPDVIFTAFGDMMRVPGTHGSPLEHKARGLDVRIVYSPLDALKLAARQSRPARHVLRHRVRDHRAVHRADAAAGQGARGSTNFSVFCNHVTIIPAIRAILDSPDMRLDGFIGPGPRLHRHRLPARTSGSRATRASRSSSPASSRSTCCSRS